MEIKLTEEQQKTLTLFAYYCRGYGGDEVAREYYYQSGYEEWKGEKWGVQYGSNIESYDAIDELIDTLISDNDLEELADDDNYMTLEFEIDCVERILSISASEKVTSQEYSVDSIKVSDNTNDEELVEFFDDMRSQGFTTGVVNFEGSDDNGAVEDIISLFGNTNASEPINDDIERLCYNMLEQYPGWEINEGSQGQFDFDFEEGTIELHYGQNIEDDMAIDFRGIGKF